MDKDNKTDESSLSKLLRQPYAVAYQIQNKEKKKQDLIVSIHFAIFHMPQP